MLGRVGRSIVTLAVVATFALSPSVSSASPWVLDEETAVVSGKFYYQQADEEFLDTPPAQPYPLNGEMKSGTFEIDARVGIAENFELQLKVPLRVTSYQADPAILLPAGDDQGFDYYQENVLNFSETVAGIADIRMAGRYQFLEGRVAGAFELSVKTPSGYDPPAGTFGEEPRDAEEFESAAAKFTQPENIEDDVTLGDGQMDVGAKFLTGLALPTRTYVRLDAGYRLRLGGAGDQVLGTLQVGQSIGSRLLLKAGTDLAYSVQTGEKIGVSVAADDPRLPAAEYEGTKNLRLRELTLDRDRLAVRGGVVVEILDGVEGNVTYSRVVWGRNTALTQTIVFGLGAKFDLSESES